MIVRSVALFAAARSSGWEFWLPQSGELHAPGISGGIFPGHFAGLGGEPRQYAQLTGTAAYLQAWMPLQKFLTVAAFLPVTTQVLFLWNLLRSLRRGDRSEPNPWNAATLGWPRWNGPIKGKPNIEQGNLRACFASSFYRVHWSRSFSSASCIQTRVSFIYSGKSRHARNNHSRSSRR